MRPWAEKRSTGLFSDKYPGHHLPRGASRIQGRNKGNVVRSFSKRPFGDGYTKQRREYACVWRQRSNRMAGPGLPAGRHFQINAKVRRGRGKGDPVGQVDPKPSGRLYNIDIDTSTWLIYLSHHQRSAGWSYTWRRNLRLIRDLGRHNQIRGWGDR